MNITRKDVHDVMVGISVLCVGSLVFMTAVVTGSIMCSSLMTMVGGKVLVGGVSFILSTLFGASVVNEMMFLTNAKDVETTVKFVKAHYK